MEEAGLQLPDFEESDFYVEQEQVILLYSLVCIVVCVPAQLLVARVVLFEHHARLTAAKLF